LHSDRKLQRKKWGPIVDEGESAHARERECVCVRARERERERERDLGERERARDREREREREKDRLVLCFIDKQTLGGHIRFGESRGQRDTSPLYLIN